MFSREDERDIVSAGVVGIWAFDTRARRRGP